MQELHARAYQIVKALGALGGLGAIVGTGIGVGSHEVAKKNKEKNKDKREILDDLLSREVQDWAKWAESVRNQASKREPSHV